MARMIPEGGPSQTGSYRAEPDIYWRLANGLGDDFIVIHSLPWLCAAVKTLDKKFAPTGELDFVILNPNLGVLAIEVKGGKFKYDRHRFVYLRSNQVFDPIGQLRRGTFALNEWIEKSSVKTRVGYAWIFPDVDMKKQGVPPAFLDVTFDERVIIDYTDLPVLSDRIIEIMQYWKRALEIRSISSQQMEKIIDLICPLSEYNLGWDARMEYDNKTWLALNDGQIWNLKQILEFDRTVISGRPGAGKTVLAIALARYLANENKRVLFLFFNKRIAKKVKDELEDTPNTQVMTFHQLCWQAGKLLGSNLSQPDWAENAELYLRVAIEQNKIDHYDALIVDEGQIFHQEWYLTLRGWIKEIHVFCDETQVFPFEVSLSNRQLEIEVIDAEHIGILTVNMRSPKKVFDRLEISLPSNYQQYSPRPLEDDTLDEKVSFDPIGDLFSRLNKLKNEGVPTWAIAVITSKQILERLEKDGYAEKIRQLADLDTSSRVRGLEFPFVIAYDMNVGDLSLPINAYARATTRVVAIYSIWNLKLYESPEREREPFIAEVLKDPAVSDAINSPWDFIIKNLGWELTQVVFETSEVYWNHNLCAWLMCSAGDVMKVNEELWLIHLLMTTDYPVYVVKSARGYLEISYHEMDSKTFTDNQKTLWLSIAVCDNCENFSLKNTQGVLCANCSRSVIHPVPREKVFLSRCDEILHNPSRYTEEEKTQSLSLSLISLAAISKLKEGNNYELITSHVARRTGNRIGYQPLLALTGIDILNYINPAREIKRSWFVDRYIKWIGESNRSAITNILPDCTNYWLKKGWITKIDRDTYRRVPDIPFLEMSKLS